MKTNLFKTILYVCLAIIVVVAAYLAITWQKAEAKSKDWVGSWDVVITVVKQNATLPGFVSFFEDGNMLTDENPSPFETSGHGSWVSTGKNNAAYTFSFLIGSADQSQWIKGTLHGKVVYDPKTDTWNGPFTIHMEDQNGGLVLDDTGTLSGTRIAPLP